MKGETNKRTLFKAQNKSCFYCRMPAKISQLTYDHFLPRRLFKEFLVNGGSLRWHLKRGNIVLACKCCNESKSDRMPSETHRKRYHTLFSKAPPSVKGLRIQ